MKIYFSFFFLYFAFAEELGFALDQSIIEANSQWTRVKLGIKGFSKSCQFSFEYMPEKWKQVKDYVYIPQEDIQRNMKYPCRIIAKDSQGNEKKNTIVFKTKNNKLTLSNQLYSYRYRFKREFFLEEGQSIPKMKRNISIEELIEKMQEMQQRRRKFVNSFIMMMENKNKKRSKELSKQLVRMKGSSFFQIMDYIAPSPQELASPLELNQIVQVQRLRSRKSMNLSMDSIFTILPSSEELDEIIVEADSYLIVKTIQEVITNKILNCQHKLNYLSEFMGRIKSALKMKAFTLDQVTIITELAQNQTIRLKESIKFFTSKRDQLNLQELRDELELKLNQLQNSYSLFNDVNVEINPKKANVTAKTQEIASLKEKGDIKRKQIIKKRLQLNSVQSQIKKLYSLFKLIARRNSLEKQITALEQEISQIQTKITFSSYIVSRMQKQITQLNVKSDKLKVQYKKLEIIVQRMREDISRKIYKRQKYQKNIQEFQERIILQEKKIAIQEIEELTNMTKALKESIPSIQEKIDMYYYECSKMKDLHTQKENNVLVYVVNPQSFESYIESTYHSSRGSSLTENEISLNPRSILDSSWQEEYGNPYNDTELANAKEFHVSSDFNCLKPSTLVNGKGKIIQINQKEIQVMEDGGDRVKLKLSSCSRLQSTHSLPKKGERVYWKGNKNGDGNYDVYNALSI